MIDEVRILLLGEAGVGKTSLILSLVSEEFPLAVPARAEELTIPADVTPERVPTHIVDFSLREQNGDELIEEIRRANVCCLVYDVDDDESIFRIRDYWIPAIYDAGRGSGEGGGGGGDLSIAAPKKPIILVGNKSDTDEISELNESVLAIMNDFTEVETCIECSARSLKNISELFYYAQKAVLHPTGPLFDAEAKMLTPKAESALARVFKVCDLDNDGVLNDRELNFFQRRCFNAPLQSRALEDVKTVVMTGISDGVRDNGLTFQGFLFLNSLFIQRGRHETTWAILRRFGYTDEMELPPTYLRPYLLVPRGSSTELTHVGTQFLVRLFDAHDKDRDGFLNPTELDQLFSAAPSQPWDPPTTNGVHTNDKGWLSAKGFLAQWTLLTLIDATTALEFFAHLGFHVVEDADSTLPAITVTRDKKLDLQKKYTSRSVYKIRVIGAKSAGKSSFLQGLLGRTLRHQQRLNRAFLPKRSVNVLPIYGLERYLVLEEIDSERIKKVGDAREEDYEEEDLDDGSCDVYALVYDVGDPTSFGFIRNFYESRVSGLDIPVLVVGLKADQRVAYQENTELQPEEWAKSRNLHPVVYFTCADRVSREVYVKLGTMAAYPGLRDYTMPTIPYEPATLAIGVGVMAGLGFAIYRGIKLFNPVIVPK